MLLAKKQQTEVSRMREIARRARREYPYVVSSKDREIGYFGIPNYATRVGDRVVHYTGNRVLIVVEIERRNVDWPGFDGVYEIAHVRAEDGGHIHGYAPHPVEIAKFPVRHLCFAK